MTPRWSRRRELSPNTALIIYYLGAILIGAGLLALPVAANGKPLSVVDALFTATSAQCVTGLVVVDTATRLSLFGQLVVLALIQIGGLGIMTFSVFLFFYIRRGVSLRGRWLIHETMVHTPVASLNDLVQRIVAYTLAIEGFGALLLALAFVPEMGLPRGCYYAVFHSVSAFCNAGFSLFADSLVGYRVHPLVNLTIIGLIVLGGIGFLVMLEVITLARSRSRQRLSLHTKLVLVTTAVLILGGALLIYLLEGGTALEGRSASEDFWIALFQSVSARTAGFNSIDLNQFEVPTLFLMMLLMFIGASPGSCGGGIKTTTLAVFFAILASRLRGSAHTTVFRRTIPDEQVTKSLSLAMLALLLVGVASFALLVAQLQGYSFSESRGVFLDYTFEAVSAFATVGLSLGVTPKLTLAGKLIIIVLMFIGRVGLLTVAFAITRRLRQNAPRYGEENIMIG